MKITSTIRAVAEAIGYVLMPLQLRKPPAPKLPRVRKDSTIITDDILRRYAEDHKGGIKRQMARELLAARGVVNEARPVCASQVYVTPLSLRSAVLEYDRVFVGPGPKQAELMALE